MQVQEVEEVDEIGLGQKRSGDVVCWQCGEKGHLQCDCPHKEADEQVEGIDDPNAYAGRIEQIIRINQPITVPTRDNIYKQMGSQRTKQIYIRLVTEKQELLYKSNKRLMQQ